VGSAGIVLVLLVAPMLVVFVVLEPPGAVVPVAVVVVVAAPGHVQDAVLQRSPHGPNPASHCSPPSGSHTSSPQRLENAMKGARIPADLAVKVAANRPHSSVIQPVRTALPLNPAHDFHRARTFVPLEVPRSRAFTGAHPLWTDTMRPTTPTTSCDGPSSAFESVVPGTT
jgi:hypothetical protein